MHEGGNCATISGEFRYSEVPKDKISRVICEFVQEAGIWALDDIRGGVQDGKDPGWSLRTLAQEAVAPRKP